MMMASMLVDLRIVGGRLEAICLGGGDFFGRDAEDVGAALIERIDFSLVDVEAGDGEFLLAIKKSERKADVAEANDSYAGLASFDAAFDVSKQG